jgi:dipeptidase E
MKLLLTSAGVSTKAISEELAKLAERPLAGLKVVFIPTAADTYDDKWFVDKDRDQLIALGMKVDFYDIKAKNPEKLAFDLRGYDIIFVGGGNTFYLLEKFLETGADKVIKDLINQGVIYIGSSAGSVLVGLSLKPIISSDDPKQAPSLKTVDGLKWVDFVVLPHAKEGEYDEVIKEFGSKFKLIPITNDQAIVVNDSSYKIIGN